MSQNAVPLSRVAHLAEAMRLHALCPAPADCRTIADMTPYFTAFDHLLVVEEWEAAADMLQVSIVDDDKTVIGCMLTWGEWQRAATLLEGLLHGFDNLSVGTQRGLLTHLGRIHRSLCRNDTSTIYFERLLNLARATNNRVLEGKALGEMALNALRVDDSQHAIDLLQEALAIARQMGDRANEARWLNNLGNAYYNLGQCKRATDFYEQAWKIAQRMGDRHAESRYMGNLGDSLIEMGEYRAALRVIEQALVISRRLNARLAVAVQLINIGRTRTELNEYHTAIALLEEGYKLSKVISARDVESATLTYLSDVYLRSGRVADAFAAARDSQIIATEIGSQKTLALAEVALGNVLLRQNALDDAVTHYGAGLTAARAAHCRLTEGTALFRLADLYAGTGDKDRALTYLVPALTVLRDTPFALERVARDLMTRLRAQWQGGTEQFDRLMRVLQTTQPQDTVVPLAS